MKLIELLIVIVIAGVLATATLSAFSGYRNSQEMLRGVDIVVDALGTARTQTVASKGAVQYGVHFAETSATIFKGTTYSAGATTNVVRELPGSVRATTALTGGGSDILFKRLTGATDQVGTVTLTSQSGTISPRVVTILLTGSISYSP